VESELRAVQLFDGVAPGVFGELVALFDICNPNSLTLTLTPTLIPTLTLTLTLTLTATLTRSDATSSPAVTEVEIQFLVNEVRSRVRA